MASQNEKKLAGEIMKAVNWLSLPLKLDRLTEAKGDCFPIAVLDQCHRKEIFENLPLLVKQVIELNDPTFLRKQVYFFISNSEDPKIKEWRRSYENIVAPLENSTWQEYWAKMIHQYEWVDSTFIQATAWYLQHDIRIVSTSSTKLNPFLVVSGNMQNEDVTSSKFDILLGSKSNVHFQSLLPTKEIFLMTEDALSSFTYEDNGKDLNFTFKGRKVVKCGKCQKEFKNILRHLQKSKCALFNENDFKSKFNSYMKTNFSSEIKQYQNEKMKKSCAKSREHSYLKAKEDQKRWQQKSREKKRNHDYSKVKADQNRYKQKSLLRKREEDLARVKADQNRLKQKS